MLSIIFKIGTWEGLRKYREAVPGSIVKFRS